LHALLENQRHGFCTAFSANLHRELTHDEVAYKAAISTLHFHTIFQTIVGDGAVGVHTTTPTPKPPRNDFGHQKTKKSSSLSMKAAFRDHGIFQGLLKRFDILPS
jgi:hypothetical protein